MVITVKNISIQFDSYDHGADKHNALTMLDSINEVLRQRFPDTQPQIMTSLIVDDDILIDEPQSE